MKTYKIIIIFSILILWSYPSFAHSGRIDSNGGHRVNKEWKYKQGKFLVMNKGNKYYEYAELLFSSGDYHFHVHPRANGYLDGIYLPSDNVHETRTDITILSDKNVVASKNSDIYHKHTSGYVNRMKLENIVIFADCFEAEENGYKPSKRFGECK